MKNKLKEQYEESWGFILPFLQTNKNILEQRSEPWRLFSSGFICAVRQQK